MAALFAACAQGNQNDPGNSGQGGAGGGGTGGEGAGSSIPPGQIGGKCEDHASCVDGSCIQVGSGKFCTVPCPPDCPANTYCAIIDGDPMCVPDLGSQCLPCTTNLECLNPSDQCLTAPAGDKFCARDCTTDEQCPNGFTCEELAKYPPKPGGGGGEPDAGAPDGGADDAGTDTDGGGTPKPPPGTPYKFCVPNGTFSCPCTGKRDGVTRSCTFKNVFGSCGGTETCNGDQSKWDECTAQVPAAESCNAKDDDCDGTKDEGEANELCKSEGPPPPNASWACSSAGVCGLGPCAPGWANFPPGPLKEGCTCPVEVGEPNDACANATAAGSVSDTAGSSLTITGTLSSQQDVDVWSFDTIDTAEPNTNSYHISIDFTAPTPNNEFLFDVVRGPDCLDMPSGGIAGLTAYDWCVDGKSADGLAGEAICANDGTQPVHCNDNSSKYYLRVHRKLGAAGTCTQYSITITGKGGDPCDFTKQCQ
jgi:hypothetical protein